MGNACCQGNQDINPNSEKLLRLISKNQLSETTSSFTDELPSSSSARPNLTLQIYDVESDYLFEESLKFHQINLEGMSQISFDNKLYLCGCKLNNINNEKENLDTNTNSDSFSSSFMYCIDILKEPLNITFEVNSCYTHYYPSLCILRSEYIVVIAGLKSMKCEYYSITNKRWKDLPDLPEERYGCCSICDNTYNCIYCFGGYNSQNKKCCMSVLKLNINICAKWDTLIVMENSEYLARKFSCIVKKNEAHYIILGGRNNFNYPTDDIVEIEVKGKKINVTQDNDKKISNKAEFVNLREGIVLSNGNAFFFDGEIKDIVHKIENDYISLIKLNQK